MPVVEESIVINRPRSEVFASALDPDNILIWGTNIIEYKLLKGTPGKVEPGAQVQLKMRLAGKTFEATGGPAEVEEGRRIKSRVTDSPIPYEVETRLEDADGGTRWTQRWEFEIPQGFFGKLDDDLVARMWAIDLRSNFEKLKELLEAR